MKSNKILIILFLFLVLGNSCETDVNVNADYEVFPVIYCVLDPSTEYQYVKVNKSFLGNQAASEMAKISDSLFFSSAEVVLKEYKKNKNTNTWSFDKTDDIIKDTGYFAFDKNTVYRKKINFGDYDNDTKYILTVNIENGRFIVEGETNLVHGATINRPSSTARNIEVVNYKSTFDYRFRAGKNTCMYQMVIKFNYLEVEGTDTISKSIRMLQPIETIAAGQNSNNDEITRGFQVATFYELIANAIEETDKNSDKIVAKRYAKMPNSIEFNLVVADENYYTYSQVSSPSTGIVQHKPSFSNIDGGLGLIAARNNVYVATRFGKATLDSLSKGIYTTGLKFMPWTDDYYRPYLTQ